MISKIIKIIIPANSYRGRLARSYINRFRNHRSVSFARENYNKIRQSYYRHFISLTVEENLLVSIIVPCFNTPPKYFEPLLNSVFSQGYSRWELVLVDASDNKESSAYLLDKSKHDYRIKYFKTDNKGIAGNTNYGIEKCNGELVAFLDHDDTLDPNAIAECVKLFNQKSEVGMVYTDEDKISDDGSEYFQPHFKPDFSLDMLRNVNYITHLVVVRKSIIDEVKGIRQGFEGAQDYDFILRVVDVGTVVGHVPKVLYHWREADNSTAKKFSNKQGVLASGSRALEEHYKRHGIDDVERVNPIKDRPGFYRAEYRKPKEKLKIVINLNSSNLLPIEKDYIINFYKGCKDVKKYYIDVTEQTPKKISSNCLLVNGPYIPKTKDEDLLSLFMVCKEEGVNGVAPMISRHGLVYDMGLYQTDDGLKPFFRDVSPNHFRSFGSLEWVRNVSSFTHRVQVLKNKLNNESGRWVIWSHTEFTAFEPVVDEINYMPKFPNYFNPNVREQTEIFEASNDYIVDLVKVKK